MKVDSPMQMSNYAMDTFVAQHFSELGPCLLPDVAGEFPNRAGWLTTFVMKRIFHAHVSDDKAPLAFAILRRAEAAFEEWELARATLAALSEQKTVSGYFKALRHLESLTAAIYQGYDFSRKALKTDFFKSGDGSPIERLNVVYNKARHADPSALPTGDLHLVWIANDGLHTQGAHVSFDELAEFLRQLGRIATGLTADPSTAAR